MIMNARRAHVLHLIALGYRDRDIARELRISEAAAKKQVRLLLRQYDVPNRAAVVRIAIARGELPSDAAS